MHHELEIYLELSLLVIFAVCFVSTLKEFHPLSAFYSLCLFIGALWWPLHAFTH